MDLKNKEMKLLFKICVFWLLSVLLVSVLFLDRRDSFGFNAEALSVIGLCAVMSAPAVVIYYLSIFLGRKKFKIIGSWIFLPVAWLGIWAVVISLVLLSVKINPPKKYEKDELLQFIENLPYPLDSNYDQ